jgi:hypothetical protein
MKIIVMGASGAVVPSSHESSFSGHCVVTAECLLNLLNIDIFILMYIQIFNCNWVDTRWQWNSTHLHTNNTQNTENGTYIYNQNIK